jgi:mannose-1-phosphate guanylyltransferase/mannose-6-phosphate isomerase
LKLGNEESLLQKTILRLLKLPEIDTLLVSTNDSYYPLVKQQIEKLPSKEKIVILKEPCRRNTAPAIAFAMHHLQKKLGASDDEAVLVLPSDHLIEPEELFLQSLKQVEPVAKMGKLVTFGIHPTKPETGFGYRRL